MKWRLLLVVVWFPLTFLLLLVNLALLVKTSRFTSLAEAAALPVVNNTRKITASSGTAQILGYSVVAGDARSLILERFLTLYGSPLAPYAEHIVHEADANSLDFRLTTAIAMCESNLGKRIPEKNSYNAWGIAVYTNTNSGKSFVDWTHAIGWVSRYIKETYYEKGISDLKDIGAIWAPPSVENGFSWSNCVDKFQQAII